MPEEDIPVRVALRCRPLIPKEKAEGCQMCLKFIPNVPQVVLGKNKAFTYDFAFGPDTEQEVVFTLAVAPLIDSIFKGYNATVLAYGQTGSGKTYSMGSGYSLTDPGTTGIIPRVIGTLFNGIDDREDTEFLLKCSYLEIHNEDINDLLNTSLKKESLVVREDPEGGIRVSGLQEVVVKNASELDACLEQGAVGRTTGSTAMNARSSRSHAIFTISIEMKKKDDSDNYVHAKFHLVDLAGSERAKKTQAQGERLKEGININRGLLALGNVISALGDENSRKGHIPYRDSKLTRLLQDALGGNSTTLMLACASPADSNMEETLNTLRYADRARQIKNKPIINRDPHTAELSKLKQQVQQLQVQLIQGQSIHGTLPAGSLEGSADLKTLLDRNRSLESANQKLSAELQSAIDQTTQMCEKTILAEMARDKLRQKLEQLKEQTDISLSALDITPGEADNDKLIEQLDVVRQLQKRIVDLETEDKMTTAESLYDGDTDKAGSDKDEGDAESPTTSGPSMDITGHTLRQAQLGRELQELNNALAMKQELAQTMGQNDEKMTVMKIHYENNMRDLEQEISTLQKEREGLSSALHAAKSNTACNKVAEQRRLRLQDLSSEITKLKKKLAEQAKLVKLKQRSDMTVEKLNKEIQSMKQVRVRLMKQMKIEADKFRQWKVEKDKEVLQLKAKDRKRQCEFSKLTQRHSKQENVLRRKMEEAAAANKRLKEALDKQKANVKKKSSDKTEDNMVGAAKRIKSWLDHELEVMVSVNEAKRHLVTLLADRKMLSQQLLQLQQETEDQPPQKKFASPRKAVDIQNSDAKERIKELQQELDMRNAQISDLQHKIVDADQDEKGKSRWCEITSMIEAKCGLKWLLERCVAAKVSTGVVQSELFELQDLHQETVAEGDSLQEEIIYLKAEHEKTLMKLQRTHEDKVLYLLTELSRAREQTGATAPAAEDADEMKKRIRFQEDQIRELSSLHEQLQETVTENEELHQQLTLVSYSGRKQSLMPTLVSPSTSPSHTPRKVRRRPPGQQTPRYTIEEVLETETESEADSSGDDESWHMTPQGKRLSRLEKRTSYDVNDKRRSATGDKVGCGCRGFCKSRLCSCVKGTQSCGTDCRCNAAKCQNRVDGKTTNDTVTSTTNSTLMNTTIVLSDTESESLTTNAKSSRPKPVRKAFAELMAANMSSSSSDDFILKPLLKKKNAINPYPGGPKQKKIVSIDTSENSAENGGIIKRKRKLLSTSTPGSFFKPLTDS